MARCIKNDATCSPEVKFEGIIESQPHFNNCNSSLFVTTPTEEPNKTPWQGKNETSKYETENADDVNEMGPLTAHQTHQRHQNDAEAPPAARH